MSGNATIGGTSAATAPTSGVNCSVTFCESTIPKRAARPWISSMAAGMAFSRPALEATCSETREKWCASARRTP